MNDQRAGTGHSFIESIQPARSGPIRNFWERSGAPMAPAETPMLDARLRERLHDDLPAIMQAPYQSRKSISDFQLDRAARLVHFASDIPVYGDKYRRAGIAPASINSWEDFRKIPPMTKPELQAAYPDGCVHASMQRDLCFQTRSSGSSGMSLRIMVDLEAIATDTLQGIRQFSLQSGLRYKASDSVASVYTVPWWTSAIDGSYINHFISSLISPQVTADILAELRPNVISLYPSNLDALIPFGRNWKHDGLHLIVTHSEQSTREARRQWAKAIDAPVLDEYSSEEGTRIALECPCGHYHSCDDTVILEILDPETMKPQQPGRPGLVVVTNLLNRAMPFIRYIQGDLATLGADSDCPIQWGCVENIQGRANDAFLMRSGALVPAGTILDVTYRMMFDNGINLRRFELIQTGYDTARLVAPDDIDRKILETARATLAELLAVVMEHPVKVELAISQSGVGDPALKYRPIKRQFV
jgi:phenylacetate-CoA ligase